MIHMVGNTWGEIKQSVSAGVTASANVVKDLVQDTIDALAPWGEVVSSGFREWRPMSRSGGQQVVPHPWRMIPFWLGVPMEKVG